MSQSPYRRNTGSASWAGAVLAILALGAIASVPVLAFLGGKAANSTTQPAPGPATSKGVGQNFPKVSSQVAAGAHDFVRFACDECHGIGGKGGVSPDVPALTNIGPNLTVGSLTNIIEHGAGVRSDPTKPFMPVWHGIISSSQIADIVAYLHAGLPPVQGAAPLPVPSDQGSAVAGSIDYINFGCINCHGPNGLGGVPNPLSADKSIPSLATADFRGEFNTAKKISDVIVSGSVIGKAPIVSMPHWGTILTQQEITDLVAYLATLK